MKGRATLGILILIVAGFAFEIAKGAVGDETALLRLGALPNDGRIDHEYWRLLSYSVLHLNAAHLVLNAALLWWVGNIVERRVGGAGVLATYFGAVLAVGVAIVVMRSSQPRPGSSLGASGGVFALLVCALVLLHRRDAVGFGQSRVVRLWLWIILAAGLAASFLPGVSLTGHAIGAAVGVLAGGALRLRTSNPSTDG